MATKPLLEATGVTRHFLGVTALNQVDISVYPGELVSLIGPNGSGKTTFFNCVSGFLKQDGGRVRFKGEDITNKRPDVIAKRGLRRTFQDVHNFPEMTVLDNLITAVQQHQEENLLARVVRTPRIRAFEEQARQRAFELLEMIGFPQLSDLPAGGLSYGQRKLLEFASALMPDPDLILLDEPTAAVSGELIELMKAMIRALNKQGKTFLIVEHNMTVVMDLSERIFVLDYGEKIAEGTPDEIRSNPKVLEAYFGR
jgi:ABC-type branched-subunit amino acid transport system ATPase component